MNLNQAELEITCSELLDAFKGQLTWKWDESFEALLAAIKTVQQDEIQQILAKYFAHLWDGRSIRTAPKSIMKGAENFIDLRAGQLLFTSEPGTGAFLYAAWWPWGNASKISVRLAASARQLT
ncbi:MAG: hypothetical protein KJ950_08990 [Proteobacteria bacterium]|nr:hypothetical protein [Pseudomonadota bacterium]MBU1686629.1 hypothetical protein [Pseudomonadota bacterium]